MSGSRTALMPERQSLILPFLASAFGHVGIVTVAGLATVLLQFCGPKKLIIDPDATMEVSMMMLPKSETNLPDRAERAPQPTGQPTPTPTPAPTDLATSDLTVKIKEAAPSKPGVDQRLLEEAMRELEMAAALQDLDAPVGTADRQATDPNSTSDEAFSGGAIGGNADPEYARYITTLQRLFNGAFRPLQKDPNLTCTMHVDVDPSTGVIIGQRVKVSSGVAAFDAAAERAVQEVAKVPFPPEKYLPMMAQGYDIRFRAQ